MPVCRLLKMEKNTKSLSERFREFVEKERLFGPEDLVLLAVSGGLDSTAMAHLFKEAGYRFGIAHCNFALRGDESDGDEAFVKDLAARLGAPFYSRRLNATEYAEEHGMSIQMAARELRYTWFAELCEQEGYACVATAHHANDSAETVLLNLARGAGPEGWAGIGAERVGVRRPLLFLGRSEIEDYARQQGLAWREDSSNTDDYYSRNYLRQHIWPHFERLNPAFLKVMTRNQGRIRRFNANYRALLSAHFGLSDPPHWPMRLAAHALAAIPYPDGALDALIAPYGFDPEQIRQMAGARDTGMWESGSGYRVAYNRGDLIVYPPSDAPAAFRVSIQRDDILVRLPDGGKLFQTPHPPGEPWPDGREAVSLPVGKLVYPLTLRSREPGDILRPFGMHGQAQKVKDLLINLRLSPVEKERVRILENGDGTIIWVVGIRTDERFRVQPGDDPIVKITIKSA